MIAGYSGQQHANPHGVETTMQNQPHKLDNQNKGNGQQVLWGDTTKSATPSK
jgi:hypothetical protein